MTRYFMRDTPLYQMEQMMISGQEVMVCIRPDFTTRPKMWNAGTAPTMNRTASAPCANAFA